MKRTIELETRAWAAAGNLIWDFGTIDDEIGDDLYSMGVVIIEVRMNFTCGAGGGVTGRELCEWIQSVNLYGGPFSQPIVSTIDAWELMVYLSTMEGVGQGIPADAAADATYDRTILIYIPMASGLIQTAKEHYPLSQAAAKLNLKLQLGAVAVNANTDMNTAEFDVVIKLHRGHSARLAHPRCIEAFQKELRERIPSGTYHGACFIAPTGGFVAAANFANIRVVADGEEIHSQLTPDAVVESYMEDISYAQAFGVGLAMGVGGVEWEKSYADFEAFPLIWLSGSLSPNRMSQLVGGRSSVLVDCQGTLADANYAIGYVPHIAGAYETKALRQLGVEPAAVTVTRDVSPEQIARRPSLAAAPFQVTASDNLSQAGSLANMLGARPVFPQKKAVR